MKINTQPKLNVMQINESFIQLTSRFESMKPNVISENTEYMLKDLTIHEWIINSIHVGGERSAREWCLSAVYRTAMCVLYRLLIILLHLMVVPNMGVKTLTKVH